MLLRHASELAPIPGILIHGRLDLSSPLATAWELAQAWPKSELVMVQGAGHASTDSGMSEAIIAATNRFATCREMEGGPTRAWSRRPEASARASLPPFAAPDPWRSAADKCTAPAGRLLLQRAYRYRQQRKGKKWKGQQKGGRLSKGQKSMRGPSACGEERSS